MQGMKCLFKKHQFKRFFDQIIGGIIGRHVICQNCHLEYAFLWHSGEMLEWLIMSDCKSEAQKAAMVRIHPSPPTF